MSKIRSIVVSDNTLFKIASDIGLCDLIILARHEAKQGLAHIESVCACAFEAVLGAYYLDGKFDKLLYLCEKSVENIEKAASADSETDYAAMMKEFIEHYCYVVKLRLPLFESFVQKLSEAVRNGKYDLLTIKEKAELINQLLIVSKSGAGRVTLNPKLGIKAEVGRLKDKTIYPEIVDWIDVPITGLYTHTTKGV